ncbi:MAG TPA: CapA family protein [Anaerolineales bacterium]|nr:CapA family protein [Anaerolineales bacterium]
MKKPNVTTALSPGASLARRVLFPAKRRCGAVATQSPRTFLNNLAILVLLLSACGPQLTSAPQIIQDTPSPTLQVEISTIVPVPSGYRIGNAVPFALREQVQHSLLPSNTDFHLDVSSFIGSNPNSNEVHIPWIYVLVAPFPTITDGVSFDELLRAWTEGTAPDSFNGAPLLMEESTLAAFTVRWDAPAPGVVRSVPADQLLDVAWAESAWAIVPFESLEPKWKVLTVDGQSPVRKGFDLSSYPLVVDFTLRTSGNLEFANSLHSNYDASKLTTVIMTGVTALVRATAVTMEYKGVTYPGERIRDVMREADIAHVSNEIPFFTDCQFPKPDQTALVFCSDPKYIDLLTDVGTDVVELTGNHFADRGGAGMLETLAIYKENDLPYFGGGADLQDSLKPALFEVNGNKIAFIGCNKPDVDRFPTARDFRPGAAPCDFPYLQQKIAGLKSQGYVVISTFQWNESYDAYPSPQQMDDFRLMAESGASIVSGSQAHYAQKMEFHNGAFIHYGLGNLFFDQMGDQVWMPRGIRREFLDRYVIYNGKFISVELVTALLEDYARPRLMTEQERMGFLREYFYYSGWMPLIETPTPTVTPTLTPMLIPTLVETPSP